LTAAVTAAGGPALRIDGLLVDSESFYAAACDPRRSCVVEACAGSGKTWMLVSRMLRALLEGAAPHEILAITFTRAAAGEMRQRLDGWLAEFAGPRSTHAERVAALRQRGLDDARAEALAPAFAALQERVLVADRPIEIRTFHGWFAQLLRAAPLALLDRIGLQPDVELVEDWDDHRPAVMRAFYEAVLADPGLRADHAAMTAARGRHQLQAWLAVAWNRQVEIALADEAGVLEGSVEPAEAVWPELAGRGHPAGQLMSAEWTDRLRALAEALGRAGKLAQDAGAELTAALQATDPEDRLAAAWEALFTRTDTPRALTKNTPGLVEAQEALALVSDQVVQHEARFEHLRMVRLARALHAAFAAYKRANGLADMADLERCALALLRDSELSGWVQERLDARIAHVLVDEFQDTSPLQWHALHAWLSAYAGAGGGASGQRPPAVFIVGDPKQSIYRFRRAEPRVFEAAAAFVREGLGGHVLACDHTRRNAPGVVAAINAVFTGAEREGAFAGFRPHSTEVARERGGELRVLPRTPRPPTQRSARATLPAVWRDSLTVPRREVEEVLREREAEVVAAAVRQCIDAGTAAGDIFVLCRKRQSLRLVATALEREHVVHGAVEETALAATTEAQDLIALLDALVSPEHRLSLARALRSPAFGVSDADLLALAEAAGEERDWWQALQRMPSPSPALERARALLPRWREQAAALPPHDLLDRIVDEGDLVARTVAAVPPEQQALALDALHAVVVQALFLDGGRYATPYGFVRALKRRVVKASVPVRAGAVRLLTIHGAKGLEADTVFVMDADPERQNPGLTTLLVDWPVDAERPSRCAFVYSEARCPRSLRSVLQAELAAREREELNGLYVAMSRAKHGLVFSSTEPYQTPAGATWWARLAPLAAEWPSPPPGRAALGTDRAAAAAAAVVTVRELPGWRRRSVPATPERPLRSAAEAANARLGLAVHRTLEWVGRSASFALDDAAPAAAREFGVEPAAVLGIAAAILAHPQAARFFRGPQIRWSGNEVSVSEGGEVLRIDRLVLLDDGAGPVWWVLDYKLGHAPDELEPYRRQLARYRAAVQAAQPGDDVRCAFITGQGRVIEVAPGVTSTTEGAAFGA
jgi:ATP-dependent helicase/nuclease subunit A